MMACGRCLFCVLLTLLEYWGSSCCCVISTMLPDTRLKTQTRPWATHTRNARQITLGFFLLWKPVQCIKSKAVVDYKDIKM